MKKFPKLIQCDRRGQIIIPKDIRSELKIDESTGFWVYSIDNEGLFLKKVDSAPLEQHDKAISELEAKSGKIGVDNKNIKKSIEKYKKTKEGKLDLI
jgi:bifunctional DNA-binding transcriptional regulator/antitoxin component of YhaV-PrlF toxin-antitoxin module